MVADAGPRGRVRAPREADQHARTLRRQLVAERVQPIELGAAHLVGLAVIEFEQGDIAVVVDSQGVLRCCS